MFRHIYKHMLYMAPPDQGKVTWGFHIKSSLHMYRYTFAFPPFQTGSTDVHPLPPPWGLRPPTALLPYLIAPPSQTLSVPISHWPFPMDKRALCQLIPEMVLGRQRNSGDLSIAAFMCVHVSGRWSPRMWPWMDWEAAVGRDDTWDQAEQL